MSTFFFRSVYGQLNRSYLCRAVCRSQALQQCIVYQLFAHEAESSFFFTRLVSGYCDKSAKEKVEKMIDVDTKVAQKSSCSIMLSISRVVSQLIARAAAPPHVAYLRITQSLLLPCSSFLFDIIFSQQVQQQCIEQYINPQWGQSRFFFKFIYSFNLSRQFSSLIFCRRLKPKEISREIYMYVGVWPHCALPGSYMAQVQYIGYRLNYVTQGSRNNACRAEYLLKCKRQFSS